MERHPDRFGMPFFFRLNFTTIFVLSFNITDK